MKIYLKNNCKVLAHYNKGNKDFFNFVKKNENIKVIKFNFLTSNKKIENFLNKEIFKKYDIFINTVGFKNEKNYEKCNLKDIENIFKINVYPAILLTKIMGKEMNKRKWGRIIHLGSIAVKLGDGKKTFLYSLSKHLLEFFPNYTKEWSKNNVLINTIRVGAASTNLHSLLPLKNFKKREKLIPVGRVAEPREIAEFIYFLGSDENSYITNKVPAIFGGE